MYFFFPQQVKSGVHQSSLTLCDMSSTETSPRLSFSATPLPYELDLASQHVKRNRVFYLANINSDNNSETPETLIDKSACASIPAAEMAKIQDYTSPQPIPEGEHGSLPLRTSDI